MHLPVEAGGGEEVRSDSAGGESEPMVRGFQVAPFTVAIENDAALVTVDDGRQAWRIGDVRRVEAHCRHRCNQGRACVQPTQCPLAGPVQQQLVGVRAQRHQARVAGRDRARGLRRQKLRFGFASRTEVEAQHSAAHASDQRVAIGRQAETPDWRRQSSAPEVLAGDCVPSRDKVVLAGGIERRSIARGTHAHRPAGMPCDLKPLSPAVQVPDDHLVVATTTGQGAVREEVEVEHRTGVAFQDAERRAIDQSPQPDCPVVPSTGERLAAGRDRQGEHAGLVSPDQRGLVFAERIERQDATVLAGADKAAARAIPGER